MCLKNGEVLTMKNIEHRVFLSRTSISNIMYLLKKNKLVKEIDSMNLITRRKVKKYKITEKGLEFLREVYNEEE